MTVGATLREIPGMTDPVQGGDPHLVWPAVDIGGTKLRVLLLAPGADGACPVVARVQRPTPRGLSRLVTAVRSAVAEAGRFAANRGLALVPALVAGTPGRYQPGPAGRRVIAPRSAMNLEATAGEFDGLDLGAALAAGLGLPIERVFIDNDAVVQGRHLIWLLLDNPALRGGLLDERVVCINPGTGLGGCVAAVAADGAIEIFTDSHVSEISLQPFSFAQQVGPVQVAVATTAAVERYAIDLVHGDRRHALTLVSPSGKQAEDLIAGTGMAAVARTLDAGLAALGLGTPLLTAAQRLDPVNSAIDGKLLSACLVLQREDSLGELASACAGFVAALAGAAMHELMQRLRAGDARKGGDFPQWSAADQARLHGVRRFVLGGGITRAPLGRTIEAVVRSAWRGSDVEIYTLPDVTDEAGACGALTLVPAALRRQLEQAALVQPWDVAVLEKR